MLLTVSAALPLHSQTLTTVPTHDAKIVKRWALAGDPHGVAVGADGTLYVGLAQPQAVVAIDPKTGVVKKKVVLDSAEIAFAYFTTTSDLTAEYPALAARRLGWLDVPLMCGHDMNVQQPNPRGVPMCIRILLLYNTPRPQQAMRFAYLRGADAIKSDLDHMRGLGGPAR